jgi:TolA-binding protein
MVRSRVAAAAVAALLVAFAAAWQGRAEEKKKAEPTAKKADKPSPAAADASLPTFYKKLGLTAMQKQEIAKVQAETREQVRALELKIQELRRKQKVEMEKVLTPEQLALLKGLRSGTPLPGKK